MLGWAIIIGFMLALYSFVRDDYYEEDE